MVSGDPADKALLKIYQWWFSGECCSNCHRRVWWEKETGESGRRKERQVKEDAEELLSL